MKTLSMTGRLLLSVRSGNFLSALGRNISKVKKKDEKWSDGAQWHIFIEKYLPAEIILRKWLTEIQKSDWLFTAV